MARQQDLTVNKPAIVFDVNMVSQDGSFDDFLDNIVPTFDHFSLSLSLSTNDDFESNLECKMCPYIVDNVSTVG